MDKSTAPQVKEQLSKELNTRGQRAVVQLMEPGSLERTEFMQKG
jgi:hypothetical protein